MERKGGIREEWRIIPQGWRRGERDEGRGDKKERNMKRGYERGRGIKITQRLNVSSEVNVKRNKNQRITGDVEEK